MNLDFRVNVPITRWTQKCAMCDQPITHGDADIEVEYRDGSLKVGASDESGTSPVMNNILIWVKNEIGTLPFRATA